MTVPRLDSTPVRTAPLPGVRVPTGVPSAAIGVPAALDVSGLQRSIGDIVQRQRDKADTTALLDADNKLATLQTDLHTKAAQLRGRDALGATQTVSDAWQKGVSDIAGTLATDQQKEAFVRRVGARWNTLYEAVETHASNEAQQYAEQTAGDALKNRLSHATEFYQQPAAIASSIDETKAILQDFGSHQGWSPETLQEKTAAAVTGIHASVIDRLVANHQDLDAADYLTQHRDEMSGQTLIQAENLVSRGSVLGAGQRSADAIMKTAPSLAAGLEAASHILDPQVREQAEERVRRSFEDQARDRSQAQLQREIDAGAIVRKTGRFDQIPATLLNGMTPIQVRDLKLLEESLRRRASDPETVNRLRNMAGLYPQDFAKVDLGEYGTSLSDADLRALQTTQRTLRLQTQRTDSAKVARDRTRQQKELTRLQQTESFYKGSNLAVPGETTRRVKLLQDSLKASAPGAPLPAARTAQPSGSGAAAPGALPAFTLPGSTAKPPEPELQDASYAPDVPDAWLAHARGNPAYAAYLATMGVSVE